jgi:hypothetical protein
VLILSFEEILAKVLNENEIVCVFLWVFYFIFL